ncbi:DUF475 domain-containing protein [Candidatus Woesearchaeota archaeon]|nr:DUF475 domain-containing protein [Candidatus Woesearchaeota archaeon]
MAVDVMSIVLIVVGLCLFETISSIDNAVINAEVLRTMSKKAQKWFLWWGVLFAVFIVRGLLPWVIIWISTPSLGFFGSLTATFSSDPIVVKAIEASAPVLLMGGGIFLVFLFFHWLFLEPKIYGLHAERFFAKQGVWFYAVISVILTSLVWISIKNNPLMALGAVIGSTAFFITHGFKQNAEKVEHEMLHGKGNLSDISKIMYLEVIDMTFSIDGVLGAFAFTLVVPLILIGNGLGAIVVRQMTVGNIERIKKYKYLKNGAMYSILGLGTVMIVDALGVHIPSYVSPTITFVVLGFFFWKSKKELNGGVTNSLNR